MLAGKLHAVCEHAYRRPRPPGGMLEQLDAGTLTRHAAQGFWLVEYQDALLHAELLGPRLLQRTLGLQPRVAAFPALHAEWGNGRLEDSSVFLLRELLIALGSPTDQLGWALDHSEPRIRREASRLKELDSISLIARAYAAATRAPLCYRALARLLEAKLGVPRDAVRYFDLRADDGAFARDHLMSSLAMVATTPDDQENACMVVRGYFEESHQRELCTAALSERGVS